MSNALQTFEGHPIFCVDAYDPKTGTRQQNKRGDEQNFAQYEKDRRSAYFGNLPLTMTSDGLELLASSCGKVVCTELATKEIPQMGGRCKRILVPCLEHDQLVMSIINLS